VPLLVTRYLPFADLPEHVAAIATLSRMMTGGDEPYVVDFARSQYLLYHAIGAVLTLGVRDAIFANQLMLALVAVLWPISVRSLLRATGRDERIAILATMLFYNRALAIGFLPYLASVPLAVFALAVLARHCARPTRRLGLALGALALLLFYMHVSSYVLFCAIAVLWCALDLRNIRDVALRCAWLAPSAVAALVWARTGSLAGGRAIPEGDDMGHMSVARTLNAFPIWTFDMWTAHRDEACAAAWWLAFAILLLLTLRTTPDPQRRRTLLLCVPVACAAAMYLVTPFRVGMASMLSVRLAPLVTLFALLPLSVPRRRWSTVPLGLAALASLGTSANTVFEGRRVSREMVGDLDGLLAKARPGARLAMLNFDRTSARTHFWPYQFAGSYYRALGGAVASWSFSELAHWPLHYAPGREPPPHHPFWVFDPCAYRYASDGAYYDYALGQGRVDSMTGGPGPSFVEVGSSGVFTLYAKRPGAPAPASPLDAEDRGPCTEK
jgi:hypothetical protein